MDFFRTDCIKSYFEILRQLGEGQNASNATFFVEIDKLYLGTSAHRKYSLSQFKQFWLPINNVGHENLEKLCSNVLNQITDFSKGVDSEIRTELFRLVD